MTGTPLAEFNSASMGTGRPTRLTVYEEGIELGQFVSPLRTTNQRVRYDQIAHVAVSRGFFFADLVIETRGGGTLKAFGLPKDVAERARNLITSRLDSGF